MADPVRVLAVWVPDWPVVAAARAAHVPPDRPAAVVAANQVVACSAPARSSGVRRGLRRREAQARCPELAILSVDPERDARAFEPVVVAVEELAPGVEVVRPGLVALPARGPAGFFGGELVAAERIIDHVAARTGVECQIGIADGLFAATLAAHRGLAVAPGDTPAFLAPLDVAELDREPGSDRAELVDLLRRLGLRSLGAFARLDPSDVASRFGADAVLAHRLARGLDPRPPVRRAPPVELTVTRELDPPVDRVDAAAFAARGLAERLHATLAGHGLSCTRLGIGARTSGGEVLHRVWRCAEPLTPPGTVDRVRWQLDAWLTNRVRTGAHDPGEESGALVELWLVPEETVPAGELQLGLWGDTGLTGERAGRALVRVQALLGPESVVTPVLVGGRDPDERVRLVRWGDDRAIEGAVTELEPPPPAPLPEQGPLLPAEQVWERLGPRDAPATAPAGWPDDTVQRHGRVPVPVAEPGTVRSTNRHRPPAPARTSTSRTIREPPAPWPGRLPSPSPATVPAEPIPARLHAADGQPVVLRAADQLSAAPHRLTVVDGPDVEITGWAGPWPVWRRWWTPAAPLTARLQVLCADGSAFLLLSKEGRWWVTGIYD
ncbi:protein ImuB [Pseudonocardia thermophila]|uniref:Protein ImuB n=1 Tax=Pseudonocardia thermophila TaxID=1848 RepID=A0A1M7AC33_PSETH|nr:DNA polymerase Y family protein [Pseudonocardia thermophila]SHL40303.1 protein ImuB [Pseudonocardia thermophila]